MPTDLLTKIDRAAELLGFSKQDTMRLAMKVGLDDLERCGFDIAGAIVERAHAAKAEDQIALVAEQPARYGTKKRA